ncbi:hypothetical protein HPB50_013243 [Hyalomma asiaticum]|uniref:Uncharacterized protein n=1 Tax=Hyalomma asiaticum TaxID=266040 RepID=A0ACB7TJT3_HYAAI|nr:hypothetical protein HPB50_013243 [Hyalomma asiaticum]
MPPYGLMRKFTLADREGLVECLATLRSKEWQRVGGMRCIITSQQIQASPRPPSDNCLLRARMIQPVRTELGETVVRVVRKVNNFHLAVTHCTSHDDRPSRSTERNYPACLYNSLRGQPHDRPLQLDRQAE